MKLHYSKILLFSLSLNILVASSSGENNKNKPYITLHTPTTTSRVLSECDLYMSSYDNDPDMKSVKKNFDRQTSQRFEQYEERINVKRQKCKEQCDRDIQKIIVKDKVQKSLSEKVEKGCLRCGCGLGGVAAGVGIFGALGTYGWKVTATATAIEFATQEGIKAGIQAAIEQIKITVFNNLLNVEWLNFINASNYNSIAGLVEAVKDAVVSTKRTSELSSDTMDRVSNALSQAEDWFSPAVREGTQTTASTITTVQRTQLVEVTNASSNAYAAIAYSVIALLIIVLVMIIIYLILRYRRKKKMNKKAQYTKLLNQ
ncbi:rifin [Plasmodium sp. gorilla clade G1]|nr:rifin [Plasmodium sp. gorilla clade G1]